MGFLDRLFKKSETRANANITATPISGSSTFGSGGTQFYFGSHSDTGVTVNEFTALSCPAVYAAINLISNSIGCMDLPVYQTLARGKQRLDSHAVAQVLANPNDAMTGVTFKSLLMSHCLGWGNAFAYIDYDAQMNPRNLLPLLPDRTFAYRLQSGELVYYTRVNGQQVTLSPHEVLHIPGFSFDGLNGLSPIGLFRQTIGLSLAYDKFGAKLFSNGLNTGGVLSHPGQLGAEAQARFRQQLSEKQTGLDNAHKLLILEEGMKFDRTSINPDDAQWLESKKFSITDIARIFQVPPHLIGDLEKSTNNNIEQQSLDFKVFGLNTWLSKWEQESNRKLFSTSDRQKCFVKFDLSNLLRADSASRAAYYKSLSNYLTINEVREAEDLNPIDNGDVILVQIQNTTLDRIVNPPVTPTPAASPAPATSVPDASQGPVAPQDGIADSATAPDDVKDADIVANRSKVDAQYRSLFRYAVQQKPTASQLRQIITPFAQAVRSMVADELGQTAAKRSNSSDDFDTFMDKYCDTASVRMSKSDKSEDEQTDYESRRARSAITREAFREAGVKSLRWIGGEQNGKTVAIDTPFIADESRKLYHPPMDYGCTSEILAA